MADHDEPLNETNDEGLENEELNLDEVSKVEEMSVLPSEELELELIQKELKECKDKYLRTLAEAENTRKRMQKEREELINFALENLICEFLIPIDHMENALKYTEDASDEVKNWAIGFQMILAQFKDVLSNNGVSTIETKGAHFDPHLHEAIEIVATDEHPADTVFAENVKGYKRGGRVIRPARVAVAKAPQTN